MSNTLKYKNLIDKLNGKCPDNLDQSSNSAAFHWVYAKISDERNFKPKMVKDAESGIPPRINAKEDFLCSCCALSMYKSEQAARNKLNAIQARQRQLMKLDYTHIAEGELSDSDGKWTHPNKDEHFDFFEYSSTDLTHVFKKVVKV